MPNAPGGPNRDHSTRATRAIVRGMSKQLFVLHESRTSDVANDDEWLPHPQPAVPFIGVGPGDAFPPEVDPRTWTIEEQGPNTIATSPDGLVRFDVRPAEKRQPERLTPLDPKDA